MRGSSRQLARELLSRPAPSRLEQILTFDRLHKLPSLDLRKLNHLAMAYGIEGRVPYCQPSVTSFAQRAADPSKLDGPRRKRILWEAASQRIPYSVRTRQKQPFTFPVDAFLGPRTVLWDFATDVLSGARLCSSGTLDDVAVKRIMAEHVAGANHARLLWGLMVLELSFP